MPNVVEDKEVQRCDITNEKNRTTDVNGAVLNGIAAIIAKRAQAVIGGAPTLGENGEATIGNIRIANGNTKDTNGINQGMIVSDQNAAGNNLAMEASVKAINGNGRAALIRGGRNMLGHHLGINRNKKDHPYTVRQSFVV